MEVEVGVVGESGLGTGSAVTDLGRTGDVVKVLRYAAMMIRGIPGYHHAPRSNPCCVCGGLP